MSEEEKYLRIVKELKKRQNRIIQAKLLLVKMNGFKRVRRR